MSSRTRHKKHKLTTGRILKMTRVMVSLAFFTAMTLLFVTLESNLATTLGWIARIQIFPLALAGATTAIAVWLGITLLFGRIYCSSVCPMGVLQDIFIRAARLTRRSRLRRRFRFAPPRNKTRYTMFVLVAGSAVMGLTLFPSIFDPYSAFGRIGSEIFMPATRWITGNPIFMASVLALAIALITLLTVGVIAARHGRLICNTVCPVGAALGIFSRWSLFHFDIDTDLCVNCRKCEHACKAKCINTEDHVIDGSRCVNCFNCVDACDSNALRYTTRRKRLSIPMMQPVKNTAAPSAVVKPDEPATKVSDSGIQGQHTLHEAPAVRIDRRKFLATGLIVASTPALTAIANGAKRIQALDRGGKPLTPSRYVAPPGRHSMSAFLEKCTGCGLCVARCPAKVLRPSSNEFGWLHPLHPVMDFDTSYCRYNCTRCTEVCPTGALQPLTIEEKHIFIIGHAQVEPANCIGCGLCASRCPRKAITLRPRDNRSAGQSRLVATVDNSACIGCGACEYICPATPMKAIVVNGVI